MENRAGAILAVCQGPDCQHRYRDCWGKAMVIRSTSCQAQRHTLAHTPISLRVIPIGVRHAPYIVRQVVAYVLIVLLSSLAYPYVCVCVCVC